MNLKMKMYMIIFLNSNPFIQITCHSGVDLLTFTAKLFPVNLCTQRLHTEYEPIPMS